MRPARVRALIREASGDELARAIGAYFYWRRFQCAMNYQETIAEVRVLRPALEAADIDEQLRRADELDSMEN